MPSPYRLSVFLSLIVMIPIGLAVRFFQGGDSGLSDFLGSVAYEMAWVLLLVLLLPRVWVGKIAIGVFLGTCVVEFLQLSQAPILVAARSTLLGRLILGNTFMWSDFWPYLVGSLAGFVWVRILQRIVKSR